MIDLNKLSEEELEIFLKVKKKGLSLEDILHLAKSFHRMKEQNQVLLKEVKELKCKVASLKGEIPAEEKLGEIQIVDATTQSVLDKEEIEKIQEKFDEDIGEEESSSKDSTELLDYVEDPELIEIKSEALKEAKKSNNEQDVVFYSKSIDAQEREDIKYQKIRDYLEIGYSFKTAFDKVFDRTSGGHDYQQYKKWCKNKGLRTLMVQQDKYMHDKSDFQKFKTEQLIKVMKYHNLTDFDAMRYLSATWKKSGRNITFARNIVSKELNKKELPDLLDSNFPILLHIDGNMSLILRKMLQNLIENQALVLTYNMDGLILGFDDYEHWCEFCLDVENNSENIVNYFKVKGRFAQSGYGTKKQGIRYLKQ